MMRLATGHAWLGSCCRDAACRAPTMGRLMRMVYGPGWPGRVPPVSRVVDPGLEIFIIGRVLAHAVPVVDEVCRRLLFAISLKTSKAAILNLAFIRGESTSAESGRSLQRMAGGLNASWQRITEPLLRNQLLIGSVLPEYLTRWLDTYESFADNGLVSVERMDLMWLVSLISG